VGIDIENGKFTYTASVNHTHEGSIGNLQTGQIKTQMEKIVASFPFDKVQSAISRLIS
jgi:argininosuccinate lyase